MGLPLETVSPCPLIAFLLFCRVRLSKRRAKAGAQSTTNAVLVCKHRDMNEKELEAQVSVHGHVSFRYLYHLLDSWKENFQSVSDLKYHYKLEENVDFNTTVLILLFFFLSQKFRKSWLS